MTILVAELTNWGLNVAFWAATSFLLVISIVWPWWKSQWGTNIMLLELAITLALLPTTLSRDFGLHVLSNATAAWLEVAALWLVGIIIIWRGGMIITEQLRAVKIAQDTKVLAMRQEKTLAQREREDENGKEKSQ